MDFEEEFDGFLESFTIGDFGETESSRGLPQVGWTTEYQTQGMIQRESARDFTSGGAERTETEYDFFFPLKTSSGEKIDLPADKVVVKGHISSSEFGSSLERYQVIDKGEDYIGYHQEAVLVEYSAD